jgi:hypothetical protein
LLSYGNAMPVSVELHLALSWAITLGIGDGRFMKAHDAAMKDLMPPHQCSVDELVQTKSIDIMGMAGTAAWTALIVCLGLAGYTVSWLIHGRVVRLKPMPSIRMEDKIEEIAYRVAERLDLARNAAHGTLANNAKLEMRGSLRCGKSRPLCVCVFSVQRCIVVCAPRTSTHVDVRSLVTGRQQHHSCAANASLLDQRIAKLNTRSCRFSDAGSNSNVPCQVRLQS